MTDAPEAAPDDLPPDWEEQDFIKSWWLAHRLVGEDVKAGRRELPEIFRGNRSGPQ